MIAYKSKWKNRDLRNFSGINTLYKVVKYYGGYLWYIENISQDADAYHAFYYHNEDRMKNKFINKANANAKKYFSRSGVSGVKMRRMLVTGAKHSVKSYDWISEYVEYILKQCIENPILRDKVFHIIQNDCNYCSNQQNLEEWKVLCVKRLLGFQYELLNEVSARNTRASKSAKRNMDEIENSLFMTDIIKECPVVAKNKTKIMT